MSSTYSPNTSTVLLNRILLSIEWLLAFIVISILTVIISDRDLSNNLKHALIAFVLIAALVAVGSIERLKQ